jgi:hypothetical protein
VIESYLGWRYVAYEEEDDDHHEPDDAVRRVRRWVQQNRVPKQRWFVHISSPDAVIVHAGRFLDLIESLRTVRTLASASTDQPLLLRMSGDAAAAAAAPEGEDNDLWAGRVVMPLRYFDRHSPECIVYDNSA